MEHVHPAEAGKLPESKEAFQRVAVVMTLIGLGGGLMIERAADRVRRWFLETSESAEK